MIPDDQVPEGIHTDFRLTGLTIVSMADDPLTAAPQKPPNILWYCTDHQRFDTVAALGNPEIRTPHLDALVWQGAAFTHAYCQSPLCCPSRASFMTGRYPSAVHVNYNTLDYFPPAAESHARQPPPGGGGLRMRAGGKAPPG